MIKDLVISVDDAILGGSIQKVRYKYWLKKTMANIESGLDYKYTAFYNKNINIISELCDKYGSDKGEVRTTNHPYPWPSHTYADVYFGLFSHCRFQVKRVFECGLGTNNPDLHSSMGIAGKPGASLRMWRDFFPNAQIYGADIDRDILFDEDRIKTFYIDQLDPKAIAEFWQVVGEGEFDFMLDDGLHTFEAGRCLFENSIKFLRDGGIYIIEDVFTEDLFRYKSYFSAVKYNVEFVSMFRPNVPLGNNNLIIIRKV